MPQYQPLCLCMSAIVREGFWENNMCIWFKIYTDTHLMRDITIENDSDDTRTHKIFKALEDACLAFDLGKPIWLDSNVSDFKSMERPALRRITLLRILTLIFLRCTSSRRIDAFWFSMLDENGFYAPSMAHNALPRRPCRCISGCEA